MAGLIGIALWALIPGFIANNKGRSFFGYYFLSFLISPLITMIITLCLSDLNKEEFQKYESVFSEDDYLAQWADIQHSVPQMMKDRCVEFSGDANRLEKYLNNCAQESIIQQKHIPAIIKQFVSAEQFEQWRTLKESQRGIDSAQQNNSVDSVEGKVTLANMLRGCAPDDVLQHCDSISHKPILLETYLMQCENQKKISHTTAQKLLEQYTRHIDQSAVRQAAPQKALESSASVQKVKENTVQAAKAAGLSLYDYVKTQLRDSVRATIEEKKDDIESMERYLRACLEQKLISEYYYDVILEESKGQCALRRLQATGGRRWEPHDILRGLAPENILNQCDKDADSHSMQIVYLDQQVIQENVTRQTADLILNIYKLAREQ